MGSLKSLSKVFVNFIKTIHANERLPEYSNISITNLRSNYAHVKEDDKIVSKNKNQLVAELIDLRIPDIEMFAQ